MVVGQLVQLRKPPRRIFHSILVNVMSLKYMHMGLNTAIPDYSGVGRDQPLACPRSMPVMCGDWCGNLAQDSVEVYFRGLLYIYTDGHFSFLYILLSA